MQEKSAQTRKDILGDSKSKSHKKKAHDSSNKSHKKSMPKISIDNTEIQIRFDEPLPQSNSKGTSGSVIKIRSCDN
jgi:hypothetical protein